MRLAGHGGVALGNIPMPAYGVVGDGTDGVHDLSEILQQIVDQRAASGLILGQKLAHLIQALLGEVQVQRYSLVGLLLVADLVGFVGGQIVVLGLARGQEARAEAKNTRTQDRCPHSHPHFFFLLMMPLSRLSWTSETRSRTLSSVPRSTWLMPCPTPSRRRSNSRVRSSARLKNLGSLRGSLPESERDW